MNIHKMTYMDSDPIRAALTETICKISSILRERRGADGDYAIRRQFVGIKKLTRLRIQTRLLVEYAKQCKQYSCVNLLSIFNSPTFQQLWQVVVHNIPA